MAVFRETEAKSALGFKASMLLYTSLERTAVRYFSTNT